MNLYHYRDQQFTHGTTNDEEELVRYNLILNGTFIYHPRNNTLTVFDCNMTRYLYYLKTKDANIELNYVLQTEWTHPNGSLYANDSNSKFVVIPEQTNAVASVEVVQWQSTSKTKIYLWMFSELSKQAGNKDLFRLHEFYKACKLLN